MLYSISTCIIYVKVLLFMILVLMYCIQDWVKLKVVEKAKTFQ